MSADVSRFLFPFNRKYSDTQCSNLLYFYANPNQQCSPLWPVVSDFYAYPYVCSYSEANCEGSCSNYYLNATCSKTGSGDNSKGARSSSYQVQLIGSASTVTAEPSVTPTAAPSKDGGGTTNANGSSSQDWYQGTGAIAGLAVAAVAVILVLAASVMYMSGSSFGLSSLFQSSADEVTRDSIIELDSAINPMRKV
jgi:hypothetical protein